jgi:hypothetical protein
MAPILRAGQTEAERNYLTVLVAVETWKVNMMMVCQINDKQLNQIVDLAKQRAVASIKPSGEIMLSILDGVYQEAMEGRTFEEIISLLHRI